MSTGQDLILAHRDGQRSSLHTPGRSAAAIHQQQNVQLGLKLVGIGMLLTTKSWEQSTSHPKDALIF